MDILWIRICVSAIVTGILACYHVLTDGVSRYIIRPAAKVDHSGKK